MDGNDILEYLLNDSKKCVFLLDADVMLVCKAACAMANSNGGVIVVGMEESGKLAGVTDDVTKKICLSLSQNINPGIPFLPSSLSKDEKQILVISVFEGNNKPYSTNSSFYVVHGESIGRANDSEVNCLFDSIETANVSWERNTVGGFSMDDINPDTLKRLREAMTEWNVDFKDVPDIDIIKRYGFLTGTQMNNACVSVCAKVPSCYLPQTRIRVSLFADTESKSLINVRLFEGNLVESVAEVTNYIYSLYPKVSSIGMLREEREPLPLVALREGILNAIIHRSYDDSGSFLIVNIFSDRLEITNSGELPAGITVKQLSVHHLSSLRNPDIANAFFRLKYIEMAGTGTLRILNECKRNQCAAPFWESGNGCVCLTFPKIFHNQVAYENKNWKAVVSNIVDNQKAVDILADIMQFVEKNGVVKVYDIQKLTGKSYASAKRYLVILKDAGLLVYVGSLKTGGWCVNK